MLEISSDVTEIIFFSVESVLKRTIVLKLKHNILKKTDQSCFDLFLTHSVLMKISLMNVPHCAFFEEIYLN